MPLVIIGQLVAGETLGELNLTLDLISVTMVLSLFLNRTGIGWRAFFNFLSAPLVHSDFH